MKAMFANLTRADFGGRSVKERRTAERKRVHVLFDEIQVAIHNGDRTTVDYLMAELAVATGRESAHERQTTIRVTLGGLPAFLKSDDPNVVSDPHRRCHVS